MHAYEASHLVKRSPNLDPVFPHFCAQGIMIMETHSSYSAAAQQLSCQTARGRAAPAHSGRWGVCGGSWDTGVGRIRRHRQSAGGSGQGLQHCTLGGWGRGLGPKETGRVHGSPTLGLGRVQAAVASGGTGRVPEGLGRGCNVVPQGCAGRIFSTAILSTGGARLRT